MMPSGFSDRAQQGVSSGAGFPGSGLYPNHDIWGSRGQSTTRNPPNPIGGGLSAAPDSEGSPTSFANTINHNTNSEADPWNPRPWDSGRSPRPVSASPTRTRNGLATGSTILEHAQPALTRPAGVFDSNNDTSGYANAFASRQRAEQTYIDPLTGRNNGSRDGLTASRQPQQAGGTNLPDRYRRGHTPSNSIHSQRGASSLFGMTGQPGNSRSFNLNAQAEDDLAARLQRAGLNDATTLASINPATQAFQLNPGTQPWNGIDQSWRFSGNVEAAHQEANGSYFGALGAAQNRTSPASSLRLDSQNSPRAYAQGADAMSSRRSSRDTRAFGLDARDLYPQAHVPVRPHSFVGGSYDYNAYTNQYGLPSLGLGSPYQTPMVPGYQLAHNGLPAGLSNGIPNFLGAAPMSAAPRREQDPARGVRSALLEEFRHSNKSSRRYDLKDIYNHVVEFSGDQHGSRFIQTKLETANSDEKDQVFREIEPNATQLMKDVFGNYVVQKFFEHGNQVQKKVLAEKMKGRVMDLSVQVYACRVVQKVMSCMVCRF